MNKKRLSLIGAIAMVALGTLVLVRYVGSAEDRALAGEELVDVLVVAQPVTAGTPAGELQQFLRVESVPVKVRAAGALASLGEAENLVVAADMVEGEQLTATKLIESTEFAATQTRLGRGGGNVTVPEGLLEVTVQLDPIRTVGGTVRPGDLVGVIVSFSGVATTGEGEEPTGDGTTDEDVTGFLLHKVLVTNVQGAIVSEPTGEATTEDRQPVPEGSLLVTLAVDAAAAEKVVFGSKYGDLWLTLEPADAVEDSKLPQTGQRIFE